MKFLRKWLILSHRYSGIALSLLVMMWFASGIVMMYAGGMPRVTPELRLERMPDLDLARVRLSPADAAARAYGDEEGAPPPRRANGRVQLLTVVNRPAYRVGQVTVFADTGDVMPSLTPDQSRTVAAEFLRVPVDAVRFSRTVERIDQWTLGQGRALPLHKFVVDDGHGTEVYVQPRTGDVATLTTRGSRALAWIGVIPHWLYFVALRENQPLWYQVVVWTSAAACVVTVLGLVLGVTQFRRTRPFRLARAIPYAGWMRWHYVTGAVFGLFTLTWAFSGLLSMEPFAWTNATGLEVPRDLFTGGAVNLSAFTDTTPATWNTVLGGRHIREIEFARILDEPYYVVRQAPAEAHAPGRAERLHQPYGVQGRADDDRVLVSATTLQPRRARFGTDRLLQRLTSAFPDTPMVVADLLTDYDSYYYSRGRQTPLPVLRVKFTDPAQTWIYVDPEMGQVVANVPRLARLERWLYNGLHSLDFSFWYNRRPLWDIGMIVLLTGGLVSSTIGFCLGLKRLRRGIGKLA